MLKQTISSVLIGLSIILVFGGLLYLITPDTGAISQSENSLYRQGYSVAARGGAYEDSPYSHATKDHQYWGYGWAGYHFEQKENIK